MMCVCHVQREGECQSAGEVTRARPWGKQESPRRDTRSAGTRRPCEGAPVAFVHCCACQRLHHPLANIGVFAFKDKVSRKSLTRSLGKSRVRSSRGSLMGVRVRM